MKCGASAFVLLLLVFGVTGLTGVSAAPPANIESLRPIRGMSYSPQPSDHKDQGKPPDAFKFDEWNPYFDSDYWNSGQRGFDFLWDDVGRGDLTRLKNQNVNLLHLYNWGTYLRDHTPFLNKAQALGIKIMVPISNYTGCVIVGGCQGIAPGAGSYQAGYDNIKKIFDNIYQGGTTPHPDAAMWGLYNEYDFGELTPSVIAFTVQAIIKIENDAGIPAANRLPITAPVSYALRTKAAYDQAMHPQPDYFAAEETRYKQLQPNLAVPPGVIPVMALSTAFQQANAQNTTTYGDATVAPMPADFWQTRFFAAVNPFNSGPELYKYITDPIQFQSAFPGTTPWNSLPPLFFSEMGRNIGGSTPQTTQGQADWVLKQIQCTYPLATNAANTTQGYFLGVTVFEYLRVNLNGDWGMFIFNNPAQFTNRPILNPINNRAIQYRQDVLIAQPVWDSVKTGFGTSQVPDFCKQ
jgi:hypothetical protein